MTTSLSLPLTAVTQVYGPKTKVFARDRWRRMWAGVKEGVGRLIHKRENSTPLSLKGGDGLPAFFPVPRLGYLNVDKVIGEGGMGSVRQAAVAETGEGVVVKFSHPRIDREFLEKEARALELVGPHENIVRIMAWGREEEASYLVMEHLEGWSLRDLLAWLRNDEKALSLPQALEIARSIVYGLRAANERGFAWGDLKPDNIFVLADGGVKLIDPLPIPHDLEPNEFAKGTISYMPPEQIRGGISPQSDMYALGFVLYEMVFGQHPFEVLGKKTATAMMSAHLEDHFLFPADPPLPESVYALIARLTEKTPEQRYLSYDELGQTLDDALNELRTAA